MHLVGCFIRNFLKLLSHIFCVLRLLTIREKMDMPDTILVEITRKQLIWYGHVERMEPT